MEWNWDLQKAFDHVDRQTLWSKAFEAGYTMCALASSLVSYGWRRRFILNREVLREIRSSRGIAARSPFAPYELAVYLEGLMVRVRVWNEEQARWRTGIKAVMSIHKDDVSV